MFWAIAVFLLAFPAALLVAAALPVSPAHQRRLATTTGCSIGSGGEALAGRLRRRRVLAAVGAMCGLWATASWQSVTWSWGGLLPTATPSASGVSMNVGGLTFSGGSFLLTINVFGLVVGLSAGVVLAEWISRKAPIRAHRLAQLVPRKTNVYVAGPSRLLLMIGASLAVVSLLASMIAEARGQIGSVGAVSTGARPWAVALIVVAAIVTMTRAAVLAAPAHSDGAELVVAREVTRCLTVATLTITATAAALGSASASLGLMATGYGYGWGDGLAATSIALAFIAAGLSFSCFVTPFWAMGVDLSDAATADAA